MACVCLSCPHPAPIWEMRGHSHRCQETACLYSGAQIGNVTMPGEVFQPAPLYLSPAVLPGRMPGAAGARWQPRSEEQVWVRGSGASGCPGTRSAAFLSHAQSGTPGPGRLALLQHRPAGRCLPVLCVEDDAPHSENGTGCDSAQTEPPRAGRPPPWGPRGRTCSREAPAHSPGTSVQKRLSAAELRGDDGVAR